MNGVESMFTVMGKMLCFKKQVAKIIFRCKGGISLSIIYFPAII